MDHKNKKSITSTRRLWRFLVAFFTFLLLFSVGGLGATLWQAKNEDDDFVKLAQMVSTDESGRIKDSIGGPGKKNTNDDKKGNMTSEEAEQESVRRQKYAELKELNSDFIGWLRIDGTKIDYPVMHTPEDSQYYIYRDFYGKKTASGTPFMGGECTADSDSIIIYGHNMKNGTMFGSLDEYQKEEYWKVHPVIWFETVEEDRQYEVFSAFTTRLLYEGEEGFQYYGYVGDLTEQQFEEFVQLAKRSSRYDTGITPEYGDQLLMLSTCSYHTENGRFVVIGCRKRK